MPKPKPRTDADSVTEVLLGSVWAGIGGVASGLLLIGCIYLFAPESRPVIEVHLSLILLGAVFLFVIGFGLSLQSILEIQWRSGKWK